jgi:hypothetical protein
VCPEKNQFLPWYGVDLLFRGPNHLLQTGEHRVDSYTVVVLSVCSQTTEGGQLIGRDIRAAAANS